MRYGLRDSLGQLRYNVSGSFGYGLVHFAIGRPGDGPAHYFALNVQGREWGFVVYAETPEAADLRLRAESGLALDGGRFVPPVFQSEFRVWGAAVHSWVWYLAEVAYPGQHRDVLANYRVYFGGSDGHIDVAGRVYHYSDGRWYGAEVYPNRREAVRQTISKALEAWGRQGEFFDV